LEVNNQSKVANEGAFSLLEESDIQDLGVVANRAGGTLTLSTQSKISVGDNAKVSNLGTFVMQTSGTANSSVTQMPGTSGGVFINRKLVQLDVQGFAGAGEATISTVFDNIGGKVERKQHIENPKLLLKGGGTSQNCVYSVDTTFAGPTADNEDYVWKAGTSFDGVAFERGTPVIDGGIVYIVPGASISAFDLTLKGFTGQITGPGTLTVDRKFNWISGTMSGSGKTLSGSRPQSTLAVATLGADPTGGSLPLILDGRTFICNGTTNLGGSQDPI